MWTITVTVIHVCNRALHIEHQHYSALSTLHLVISISIGFIVPPSPFTGLSLDVSFLFTKVSNDNAGVYPFAKVRINYASFCRVQ